MFKIREREREGGAEIERGRGRLGERERERDLVPVLALYESTFKIVAHSKAQACSFPGETFYIML